MVYAETVAERQTLGALAQGNSTPRRASQRRGSRACTVRVQLPPVSSLLHPSNAHALAEERSDDNQQRVVGGSVFLAYYHTGFTDESPELLDVCASEASAAAVIEAHKRDRDRDCEYKDKATWWTKERTIRTANGESEARR